MCSEWWIRYLLLFGQNGIKKITDVLANYRIHSLSKTGMYQKSAFKEERKLLLFYLAKINEKMPVYILNHLEQLIVPELKHVRINWEIAVTPDARRLSALFYRLFAHIYYGDYRYDDAKDVLFKYFKNGAPGVDGETLILLAKVFAVPKFLINILRKSRHRARLRKF
jgi:hypothetical protein